MRVRKKPVIVEAFQWQAKEYGWGKEPASDAPDWFKQAWKDRTIHETFNDALSVDTLEGRKLRAKNGDYVIRGVRGELYPCAKDIFEETYDILDGPVLEFQGPWYCVEGDCELITFNADLIRAHRSGNHEAAE